MRITTNDDGTVIVSNDNTTIGYAVVDSAKGELTYLFVNPLFRRQGYGTLLLNPCLLRTTRVRRFMTYEIVPLVRLPVSAGPRLSPDLSHTALAISVRYEITRVVLFHRSSARISLVRFNLHFSLIKRV
ncbi:MAG: GNAT family N-acetyltransferase [Rhodospirillaceae bacterium]|nr:GNAT family N-acetyltransferase [Rhodospirillaceae bacterium]